MTPLAIEILLHYHTRVDDYRGDHMQRIEPDTGKDGRDGGAVMRAIILIAAVVLLSACTQAPDWTSAPEQYVCTMDQAKQVDYETRTCNQSGGEWSGYRGQYCYASALIRNCSKKIGGQVVKNNG